MAVAPSYFTFNRSTNWRDSFLLLIKQTMPGGYMSTLGFGIRSLMFIIHPEVHSEFQAGNFVIRKTPNISSGMSTDQHMNKTITW